MTIYNYLTAPEISIAAYTNERIRWTRPLLILLSIAALHFSIQLFLSNRVENALLKSLSATLTENDFDQLHTMQRLNAVSYGITSLATTSACVVYTLFVAGWILIFNGSLQFQRLLALNSFALLPVLIHSILTMGWLLYTDHTGFLDLTPPFAMSLATMDMLSFSDFIRNHPVLLVITRTGYVSQLAVALFVCLNLVYSRMIEVKPAIAGVVLCAILIGGVQFLTQ